MTNQNFLPLEEKKPSTFHYAYIIVLVSFFILIMSGGTQYSFGIFFKPMLNEFGWTRAATSGAYSLNMMVLGLFGFISGRLCDKYGPRLVVSFGGLFLGLGTLLMSQVQSIWQIYLFFGLFTSIGVGSMSVPLMSATARWFSKRRGLAGGIVISGVGVGIIVMPPLANLLISSYNWRVSYIILGSLALVLVMLLAQFLRRPPAHNIQSVVDSSVAETPEPYRPIREIPLREAVSTRSLWMIGLLGFTAVFGMQMVMVHIVAHTTDINFSATVGATIISVIGFVSVGAKIIIGGLIDKFGSRRILIIILILSAAAFLWLRFAGELWMLYLFAVVLGLNYGGLSAITSPLVARFFGLKDHGAIYGLIQLLFSIGGATGPLVAGRIFDVSGSYDWAFILCAVMGAGGVVLAIFLRAPQKQR
jgi:MFS family permease